MNLPTAPLPPAGALDFLERHPVWCTVWLGMVLLTALFTIDLSGSAKR